MDRKFTLRVVKKNSPGDSCRKRTPWELTGASRSIIKSLEKAKQPKIAAPTAKTETNILWRSSSK